MKRLCVLLLLFAVIVWAACPVMADDPGTYMTQAGNGEAIFDGYVGDLGMNGAGGSVLLVTDAVGNVEMVCALYSGIHASESRKEVQPQGRLYEPFLTTMRLRSSSLLVSQARHKPLEYQAPDG